MTAVTTLLVRTGGYLIEHAATGEIIRQDTSRPDIYGHVYRIGLRAGWWISVWKSGPMLAYGRTWTRAGAWDAAIAAAHQRPQRGVR